MTTVPHMNFESASIESQNISAIEKLFPSCITEVLDEEKSTKENKVYKHAVDFEKLKSLLGGDVAEGDEAYEFTWVGKKAAIKEAATPVRKTLRPCKEESKNWDTTQNLYIEGDNLDVLKMLQESYLGKVKMIYIDPPYNTGNDFIYNDSFEMDKEEYAEGTGSVDEDNNKNFKQNNDSNPRFHSDWCSMIYPRLALARNLLTDDGVIFISIDDNENAQLRKICDEIFGEENLVSQIPWQSRASIQNDTDFSVNHEYILVYANKRRQENRRLKESNIHEWHKKESFVCKPLPLDKSKFANPDNDPRGLWKSDPFDAPNIRPNLTYPITNPNTGLQHLPPRGRHWRTEFNQFSSALKDGRILFGQDGKGRPQLKVFYEEKKELGSIDNSWFSADRVGTTTNGTKELMQLFDGGKYFDMPKPVSIISKLLYLANLQNNSIILDFFSGSATTAHAVMQLNAEDGGNRKFIMVQLPEVCDEKSEAYKAGYKTICEIGKERIRRAGEKILTEWKEKKTKEDESLIKSEKAMTEPDIGFRVFKADSTNMKDVYYTPAEYSQDLLKGLESNIKEDRTDMDLLSACLLDWGLELSLPYSSEQIEGVTVHTVNNGDLIACFAEKVPESVVHTIAERKPMRVVFRDSSFADTPTKINVLEIFKTVSPNTSVKVM